MTVDRARLRDLRTEWERAAARLELSDDDGNVRREQEARDALVDYVEANGLNYTQHDPRGGADDLPPGYRWATEEEMNRPDAIVVKRSADVTGRPYVQDEADVAVPISGQSSPQAATN